MTYVLHLAAYIGIYTLIALGLNFVVGYCGLITLASSSLFALGAYAYCLLTLDFGWNLPLALVMSTILSLVGGAVLAALAYRFQGDMFSIASLAFAASVHSFISSSYSPNFPAGSLHNLTNGSLGISLSAPRAFGHTLSADRSLSVIILLSMVVASLWVFRLFVSPWGNALASLRDDQIVFRALGKHSFSLRTQAILLSTALTALAGALYAANAAYVDPSLAALDDTILLLAAATVGGFGTVAGSLLGACLFVLIPELLVWISFPPEIAAHLRVAFFGLALTISVHARPQGLLGSAHWLEGQS